MKKRPPHPVVLGLIAALGSLAMPAQAQQAQQAATQALVEQGQYWQSRGDLPRAMDAWQKLLRADPDNPDALYGMARAQWQAQRTDEARRALEQLRRAHPGHRLVLQLQQEIGIPPDSAPLQQARALARAGQAERAVDRYQAALGGQPPTGPLALEYYQALGGTSGGWLEARRGLERLAREAPHDAQVALALAQHLTYRPSTRREGLARLARLSGHPEVAQAATDSWRKALAWTGRRAADIPLYQAFLRAHPGDAAVLARLRETQARQRKAQAATLGKPALDSATSWTLVEQARAAAGRGDDDAARQALEDALRHDPGNPWARLDLARLYRKGGATSEARAVMEGLPPSQAHAPEALYAGALFASEANDWTGALAMLERIPERHRSPDIAALQARAWEQVQAAAMPAAAPPQARAEPFVDQARMDQTPVRLDTLAQAHAGGSGRAPTLSVGVLGRARQGEAGLNRLSDLQAPVALKFAAGDGMVTLRATPTRLDAGTPDTRDGALGRFGGGPATALDTPLRSPGPQGGQGVGLGVGYEASDLALDLGTLPLGWRQADFMGGVRYRMGVGGQTSLTGELSRRPVTDSVLSFAGARDARTGEAWGAVSASGVRLDLGRDDGHFGTYAVAALHRLEGRNVQSNVRAELGGGLYWHLHRSSDAAFTAGLNLTGLHYDKNLRYFTPGHGGYFSPQQFLALSLPFDWTHRTGRLSYQVKGALGAQSFREDSAPYFPTSSARQDAAALAAAAGTLAVYPGQRKAGLGYRLGMSMEYQLDPQLFLGTQVSLDNARDYRQLTGGLYLRYALQPSAGRPALPVAPLKSPYAPYSP